ncbi:MAG: DUF2461 domain-containing protein [Bacteroidetes bacterium]|nr:DUF2461 domain-containing protein [Bacteroidota bacterium]
MNKSTVHILQELSDNNTEEWVQEHILAIRSAKHDFKLLVQQLIEKLQEFDHHLLGLEAEDCIFPQKRNLAISRFKAPYKTHFGAYIAMGGRKSEYAGYYIQVQPGNSFLAGGMYAPAGPVLKKLHQELEYTADELRTIINNEAFMAKFGGLEQRSIQGAPKGFPKDHKDIDLLSLSGFFAVHELSDKSLVQADFAEYALSVLKSLYPLNKFLNETFIN